MKIEIFFQEIGQHFSKNILYENLNGKLTSGQCTAITGRNGAGKSTLLRTLTGQISPSIGKIFYKADSRPLSASEFRKYTSFVTQELQFYENMTALENLKLFTGLAGKYILLKDLQQFTDFVHINIQSPEYLSAYSTGMKQRLKIALLLAVNRPVWILDEPSSNLDAAGRQIIQSLLTKGQSSGRTILLATNDEKETLHADKIINLS